MHNCFFSDMEKSEKVVHITLKRPAVFVQLYNSQRASEKKTAGRKSFPPADLVIFKSLY